MGQCLLVDNRLLQQPNTGHPRLSPVADILTAPCSDAQTADFTINVNSVGPTTWIKTAAANGSINPFTKPWSTTTDSNRSFILDCVLSNHPGKALVKQLIYDLQYGCAIG